MKHINQTPPSINQASTTKELMLLEQVISKCLEKEPEMRYKHLDQLKYDLLSVSAKPGGKEAKRLSAECRKTALRRYLREKGKALFCSLMATVAVSALIYKVQDTNYKNAVFNDLVSKADSHAVRMGVTNVLWRRALAMAEELNKSRKVQGLIYQKIAETQFDRTGPHIGIFEGSAGTKELIKATELLKKSDASSLQKIEALEQLIANLLRYKDAGEHYYYTDEEDADATMTNEKARVDASANKIDLAISTMEEAYSIGGGSDERASYLAFLYSVKARAEKDPSKAIEYFEKCLSMDNSQESMESNWIKLDKAMRSAGMNPYSYDDRLKLAQGAEARGDLKSAALEYHAALAQKQNEDIANKLGQIQKQIKQSEHRFLERATTKATPYIEQLVKLQKKVYPKYDWELEKGSRLLADNYKRIGEYHKALNIVKPIYKEELRTILEFAGGGDEFSQYSSLEIERPYGASPIFCHEPYNFHTGDNGLVREYIEYLYLTGKVRKARSEINKWFIYRPVGYYPAGLENDLRMLYVLGNCYLLTGDYSKYHKTKDVIQELYDSNPGLESTFLGSRVIYIHSNKHSYY